MYSLFGNWLKAANDKVLIMDTEDEDTVFLKKNLLEIHRVQLTVHNSPCTNSPHTIHNEKLKIPLDKFLILLDDS
jgi:hypothetical protein